MNACPLLGQMSFLEADLAVHERIDEFPSSETMETTGARGVFSEEVQRLNKTIDTKEEAIERSMGNANERWKTAALDTIVEIAQKTPSLTSDDVLAVLDRLDVKTHDTRALGGIFVQAARLGWIRKTGAYVPSKRPACHSRPILVWESLLRSA